MVRIADGCCLQILEMAAPYMTEETNVIALVMFISSSDWLEATRLYAEPEWHAVTEESMFSGLLYQLLMCRG